MVEILGQQKFGPSDPWARDLDYGGGRPLCGRQACGKVATRIAFASPSFRITTCDEHEDEIMELVKLAMSSGPYTGKEPPANFAVWQKHHRSWYDGPVAIG